MAEYDPHGKRTWLESEAEGGAVFLAAIGLLVTSPILVPAYLVCTKEGRRILRGKQVWKYRKTQDDWELVKLDKDVEQREWESSNLEKAKALRAEYLRRGYWWI